MPPGKIFTYGIVLFCFMAYVYHQRWVKQKEWKEIWLALENTLLRLH
jgi:hypothetical protein